MSIKKKIENSIDDYIERYPKKVQRLLKKLRLTIRGVIPDAHEKISYGIPTFKLKDNVVHFAAFENHIGFYPGPLAIKIFKKDLLRYKTGKGSIQFLLDEPLPLPLVKRIVKFRKKMQD